MQGRYIELIKRLLFNQAQRARVKRELGWQPPTSGWLKLNTNSASDGNRGFATAGGVIRDGEGRLCAGFSLNIGRCSTLLAELWGVYYGLVIAWERKIPQLDLVVD